jgi:hypothetical protein
VRERRWYRRDRTVLTVRTGRQCAAGYFLSLAATRIKIKFPLIMTAIL